MNELNGVSASPCCLKLILSPAQQWSLQRKLSCWWAVMVHVSPKTVWPHACILQSISLTGSLDQFAQEGVKFTQLLPWGPWFTVGLFSAAFPMASITSGEQERLWAGPRQRHQLRLPAVLKIPSFVPRRGKIPSPRCPGPVFEW